MFPQTNRPHEQRLEPRFGNLSSLPKLRKFIPNYVSGLEDPVPTFRVRNLLVQVMPVQCDFIGDSGECDFTADSEGGCELVSGVGCELISGGGGCDAPSGGCNFDSGGGGCDLISGGGGCDLTSGGGGCGFESACNTDSACPGLSVCDPPSLVCPPPTLDCPTFPSLCTAPTSLDPSPIPCDPIFQTTPVPPPPPGCTQIFSDCDLTQTRIPLGLCFKLTKPD